MEQWDVDYVNSFLAEVHSGKVECKLTENKGRILVSKTTFGLGDVIFEERPLHIVKAAEQNPAYKAIKKLCRKDPETFYQDPTWYWAAVSSLTSAGLGDGLAKKSVQPIDVDTQRRILCLYHEPSSKPLDEAVGLIDALGLAAEPALVDELLRAWILNCFDHSEEPLGYAAYFGASFMSHSCHPNAIWHFAEGTQKEDTFVLRARREISPGDELCISYLPEKGLLQSAAARKTELRSSKSFVCTCERCGPGAAEPDRCRGFRCPGCGRCAVFHPGPLTGKTLSSASCEHCRAEVGEEEAKRLLDAEAALAARLKELDEKVEKRAVGKVLKEADVQHMLRLVGDSAAGSVGPQHWLCDRLWAHLADWYDQVGRSEDACRMHRLRAAYQRAGYAALHGELAWALEEQANLLLKYAGVVPGCVRLEGLDDAAVRRVVAEASRHLDEAIGILKPLFGGTHSYFAGLEKKRGNAAEFLITGRWPSKRQRSEE